MGSERLTPARALVGAGEPGLSRHSGLLGISQGSQRTVLPSHPVRGKKDAGLCPREVTAEEPGAKSGCPCWTTEEGTVTKFIYRDF